MARSTTPAQFIQQTRTEIGKIAWPSRREVTITTIMVVLLAAIAAIFFSLVDLVIRFGLNTLLSFF